MGIRTRRLLAWGIDVCCILGWVALVATVGVPLYVAGAIRVTGLLVQNLVGLIVIIPVVLWAGWMESRPASATPGKRLLDLYVRHGSGHPGLGRALMRNTLKIGMPWGVGHVAVFALIDTASAHTTPLWVVWLTGAAYLLPTLWVASLLLPGARPIYDRLSITNVHVGARKRLPQGES